MASNSGLWFINYQPNWISLSFLQLDEQDVKSNPLITSAGPETATVVYNQVDTTEAPTNNGPQSATAEDADILPWPTVIKKKQKPNNFREAVATAVYVEQTQKDRRKKSIVISDLPLSPCPDKISVAAEVWIKISLVRSRDTYGKVLLAQAFRNFNWKSHYAMNNCDEMVAFFNTVVYGLFYTYFPLRTVYMRATDKPGINDDFRALIKRRQHAWSSGNKIEFQLYRIKVQRAARYLRSKYIIIALKR
jgi:hypothetical protein